MNILNLPVILQFMSKLLLGYICFLFLIFKYLNLSNVQQLTISTFTALFMLII